MTATNKPCWAIETDPMCQTMSHLTLKVERNQMPAPDTHVISYCVTCTDTDMNGQCDMQ
jgi:hypothetical protein